MPGFEPVDMRRSDVRRRIFGRWLGATFELADMRRADVRRRNFGARLGATFELKLWAVGYGLWALRGALRGIVL